MSPTLTGLLTLALLIAPSTLQGQEKATGTSVESSVRAALRREAYPWYDAENDRVKPILEETSSWTSRVGKWIDSFFDWLDSIFFGKRARSSGSGNGNVGGALITLLFLTCGAVLVFVLWRLWKLHEPQGGPQGEGGKRVGDAARIAGLAPGMSLEETDPWSEAVRRRAAGDLAGAVIWLFLDQIVSLERAGLIRLTPGRTARQYVQSLHDPLLREGVRATLGVFESVYYGRRGPEPEALARVWSRAEAVRGQLQAMRAGGA
jgi:hypothetical protein